MIIPFAEVGDPLSLSLSLPLHPAFIWLPIYEMATPGALRAFPHAPDFLRARKWTEFKDKEEKGKAEKEKKYPDPSPK